MLPNITVSVLDDEADADIHIDREDYIDEQISRKY